jgi:putative DNA primase/helicase
MDMPISTKLGLRKTARIHNLATGTYLERIEFKTSSRKRALIELLPSIVSDQRLFAKHLRDAGAILPTDKATLKKLLETTARTDCGVEIVYAAQGGWTKNGKAFVRPDTVIGTPSSNVVGFQRSKPTDLRGKLRRAGSVASWKSSIAAPARSSSILIFTISVAFATALLKMTKNSSFGFCLFGVSRSGKTLATVVAGSVIGNGSTSHLLDWNATDNRLQEQLPELNDCLTPIDDLMSMKGSDRDKYERVKSLAYIFSLGAGTGRHSSFSRDSKENWRTIVLSSNEFSLRDLAIRSRAERNPGETVRLIDLPATFNGATDIFDRKSGVRQRLSWEDWFNACEKNQGVAFEAFLRSLIAQKAEARRLARDHLRAFAESVRAENDGNFARDIAQKFGLVYAAGELAIQFQLVPWTSVALHDAVKKCYLASRDLLPDEGVTFRAGKQALLSFLKSMPKKAKIDVTDNSSLDGFSEEQRLHFRCLVKREKFNSIFKTDDQYRIVTNWLMASNSVSLATTSSGPRKIKEQHFWPDGKRYRSVEILWPKIPKHR